jgi:hypothetical protein
MIILDYLSEINRLAQQDGHENVVAQMGYIYWNNYWLAGLSAETAYERWREVG